MEKEYLVDYLDGDMVIAEWFTEDGLQWLREEGYEIIRIHG